MPASTSSKANAISNTATISILNPTKTSIPTITKIPAKTKIKIISLQTRKTKKNPKDTMNPKTTTTTNKNPTTKAPTSKMMREVPNSWLRKTHKPNMWKKFSKEPGKNVLPANKPNL